ncbi:hypothetical protein LO762_03280 [Actinocorallia sp. API 0066]|uniref:HAAS signaling domain-containing protein n=1 Tax=Actinocorallia sp. API 0066 TaxID=2896846 RepID=UPI001E49B72A|nr:hypothetical protein [Actinocorallia sp. API 0066]MCD0448222.1 hypothetical protein [Actinocorallia sp. API 0066]
MSTVTDYAAAVRAALADVPPADRAELLEDLEEHLAEVAAEHDGPLAERLGTPESYAAELRAAYSQTAPVKPRRGLRARIADADRRVRETAERLVPANPAARDVLHDLRPVWWVARGVFAALLVEAFLGGHLGYPRGVRALFLLLVCVSVSFWLGRRARGGAPRHVAAVLGLAALTLVAVFGFLGLAVTSQERAMPGVYHVDDGSPLSGTVNIYPYSRDGKPLKDVLLYDQNGTPIVLDPDRVAWSYTDLTPAPALPNAYPKALCEYRDTWDLEPVEGTLVPACPPDAAPPDVVPAAPAPTDAAPSPETPADTPSPTSTPTPPTPTPSP